MEEHRQRCYECFRPLSFCFCDAIPQIDNLTDVLILQHVGERFHPFNTARIVKKALRNCQLIVDHNHRLGTHNLPILANAGLLYPGENAPVLSDLSSDERPEQLIIIDGTWHQAKTIVRDVLQLHDLPCYRLAPTSPGQYRIRREPNAHSLSTLEATVGALHALEPSTTGLDQLLDAFDQMADYYRQFDLEEKEMSKYIIGTISQLDAPLTPSMKGSIAASRYISHISQEDIQQNRDEVLSTSCGQVRDMAEILDAMMNENRYCVLGNESRIKEESELFGELMNVFE